MSPQDRPGFSLGNSSTWRAVSGVTREGYDYGWQAGHAMGHVNATNPAAWPPPVADEFSAPIEQSPSALSRPPRVASPPHDRDMVVWQAIASRHPYKYRRALMYLTWLDRMQQRYSSRLL